MIIDNSSRFLLVETPLAYPNKDIILGAPEGPVFDLSVDLDDQFGVGYLRVEHVKEMAKVLGMLSKEEADILRARNKELEDEAQKLPEGVKELVDGIAGLVSAYRSGGLATGTDGISVPVYLADKESLEESDAESDESADSSGDNSSESDELDELLGGNAGQSNDSAELEGPDKLPADSSDEFGFGDAGASR